MKVSFVPSLGGFYVRSLWPAKALADDGWEVNVENHPASGDVVVMHTPLATDSVARINAYQQAGKVVLFDIDDNLRAAPKAIQVPARTPVAEEVHDAAISSADAVIAATPAIAETYGKEAKQVFVCRNALPARYLRLRPRFSPRNPPRLVRACWTGVVHTHLDDLHWVKPAIKKALAGGGLLNIGDRRTPGVLSLTEDVDSYEFLHDIDDLYRMMVQADIGLVPLEPSEFNRSKSYLKALEFMTLGKPVVVTDFPEQRRLVAHGETGFLVSTAPQFARRVQELIKDPALRERMGAAAREKAAKMVIEKNLDPWKNAISTTAFRLK